MDGGTGAAKGEPSGRRLRFWTDHAATRGEAWDLRQQRAREVWLRHLSMAGFFSTMHDRLSAARHEGLLVGRGADVRLTARLS